MPTDLVKIDGVGGPDPLTSVAIEGNAALGTHSILDVGESTWERELGNPQQEEKKSGVGHVKHPN